MTNIKDIVKNLREQISVFRTNGGFICDIKAIEALLDHIERLEKRVEQLTGMKFSDRNQYALLSKLENQQKALEVMRDGCKDAKKDLERVVTGCGGLEVSVAESMGLDDTLNSITEALKQADEIEKGEG